jgi:beta-galactosidase
MISKFFIGILFSATVITPSYSQAIRLNSGWEFLKGDLGGIWEAVRPYDADDPESVPRWTSVSLPHCFNETDAVDPDLNYYQGPGWYRARVKINNPYPQGKTILHFEGSGQKTSVYVYMTKVGEHVGGCDEWSIDITEAVAAFKMKEAYQKDFAGTVPIAIRCDNSRDIEMIPSDLSDFNLYGGIYRYLNLVYRPSLFVEQIPVTTAVLNDGKLAEVNMQIKLNRRPADTGDKVEFSLFDPSGKLVDQHSGIVSSKTYAWKTIVKKPSLWSPDSPLRYEMVVTVKSPSGTDIQREKIGFRYYKFEDHGPFLLNGSRLLLRGTSRHEDHAGVGNAMTETQMRTEMVMIKNMGTNFIRLGHYQQSRIILNLCDSLGILVWEEIPWCRGGLGNEVYRMQARSMLTNMIEQHFNHPAIIIWGLGNENDWPGDFPEFDKEKIRTFMKELNDLAHYLDPSRQTAIRRCAFCSDIVDVYSPSIWAGWYRGSYTEYREVTEKEFKKVKHFLHMEWGGDSHAGRHAEDPYATAQNIEVGNGADERPGDSSLFSGPPRFSKDGDWSETYACDLIDWHLKEQEKMPWLTGTAYWPFKDFSTPIRPENPVPYVNQKGVVERDFNKKESYYVFQSYWTDKPMVHIYGHSWPVRWGNADSLKLVKVYSNCDEAELFVNEKSYGIKKRDSQDFPAAGLHWKVRFKEGENHLRVVATKGRVKVVDDLTQEYQTTPWEEPAQIEITKKETMGDTVTMEIKLLDKQNVQCLDARNWVYFSLLGDGKLIDNLGTSSGSRKVQAYNGRAVIRVDTRNGKNIVGVKSPGIPTAFLDLDKKQVTP